jgi:uncharacterized membrane-anchored protein YhcB (DUF1043 family)
MDTLSHSSTQVPDFGIFESLTQYGALGLIVLALGYVAWYFIKRNLAEQDRLRKKLEEMQDNQVKNKNL